MNCHIAFGRGDRQIAMQHNTSIDSNRVPMIASTSRDIAPLENQAARARNRADERAVPPRSSQQPPLRRVPRWAWYSTGAPLACRWDVPLFFS